MIKNYGHYIKENCFKLHDFVKIKKQNDEFYNEVGEISSIKGNDFFEVDFEDESKVFKKDDLHKISDKECEKILKKKCEKKLKKKEEIRKKNIEKFGNLDPYGEEDWENESKIYEGVNSLFKEYDKVKVDGFAYVFRFDKDTKANVFDFDEFEKAPYLYKEKVNVEGVYLGYSKFKTKNEILYIVATNIIDGNHYDVCLTILGNIWLLDEKEFAKRGMEYALLANKTKEIDPYQEENWEN
jgi:hypothetical protein